MINPETGKEASAQEMSRLAEDQMKNRVMTEALQNPGQIAQGAQMGQTPAGQGLAPEATYWQTKATPANPVNVLTSNKASAYVKDAAQAAQDAAGQRAQEAANAVNQQSGTLGDYTAQASGTRITDASRQAYIDQLPPPDPNETGQEKDLRNAVLNGGFGGLSAGNALTALTQLRKQRELMDKAQKNLTEEQTSQTATTKASEFRMGQSGTGYAQAALAKLADRQQQQMDEFNRKKQDALNAAWDSALNGNYKAAEGFKQEALQISKDQAEAQKVAMENRKSMLEYNDMLEKHGTAVVDRMVASGYQPSEEVLAANDQQWGLAPGTSRISYEIAQQNKKVQDDAAAFKRTQDELKLQQESAKSEADVMKTKAETARIFNDLKNSSYDTASKTVDMLSKIPSGQTITIGGKDYAGWNTNGLKQGIEMDDTGNATGWTFDPQSGKYTLTDLGNIGAKKDGFSIQFDNDGNPWSFNQHTGQLNPVFGSEAQQTYTEYFPDGTTGPALPGHEVNAGQCGAFNNYCYGVGILGDSFAQKKQAFSKYEVDRSDVQVGDSFLMSAGSTGHVGIVNQVSQTPDGKMVLRFTESNYVPPNGRKMSNTRTMSIDDPKLKMFARIPTPNLPLAGTDAPKFGAKPKESRLEMKTDDQGNPWTFDPSTGSLSPMFSAGRDVLQKSTFGGQKQAVSEKKLVYDNAGNAWNYDPKDGAMSPVDVKNGSKPSFGTAQQDPTLKLVFDDQGNAFNYNDKQGVLSPVSISGEKAPPTQIASANPNFGVGQTTAQMTSAPKFGNKGGSSELDKPLSFDELEKYNRTLPVEKRLPAGSTLRQVQALGAAPGGASSNDPTTQFQNEAVDLIDRLLVHPGLNGAVGVKGPTSLFGLKGSLPWTEDKPFAGTQAAGFVSQFDRLRSLLTVPNLKLMKGLGQMSEKEMKVVQDAATSINRDMSETEFKTELERVRGILNKALGKSEETKTVNGVNYSKGSDGNWHKVK